ncbi:hypothetical protein BGX21_006185 [Mortierella sp. AD011]|nr:hypothetical protein BGX20_004575 [Mortierella sp. AD010]KAF9399476.1 hypothetical protein BGX21_006185 [Mortierella sp. AD011]
MNDSIFSRRALRRKSLFVIGSLVLVNIIVWVLAAITAKKYPSMLGSMVIAYTLGLRHAVDADHLAAIDNVTRKLMYQESIKSRIEGQELAPPVCVGLFFSLGHSTIVVAASVVIAATAAAIEDKFEAFGATGGIIGTSVSSAFLFLIGFINLIILIQVAQELRSVHRTGEYRYRDPVKQMVEGATAEDTMDDDNNDHHNNNQAVGKTDSKTDDDTNAKNGTNNSRFQPGGLFARIFRPLFNLIDRSWKMYPLGVLFGLGFDTATEVGLLGIAATHAEAGFPTAVTLIFPALFTVAMSLIDTLDGIIMANAYGWAFVNPVKKLWYNFVVTLMGVIVAFVVGAAELLGLLAAELNLDGPFWNFFTMLSDNFGLIGYIIVGLFVFTWIFAVLFYKYGPIKGLEDRVIIVEEGEHSGKDVV